MRIRVNSNSSETRQRFTLAHELAHLILGTRPGIAREPFRSETAEERAADQLAGELLIPESKARACLGAVLPVDARTLQRLAIAAAVSPIMAACRVVNLTTILGLRNAAVVFFDSNGQYQWRHSSGLSFTDDEAVALHSDAVRSNEALRAPNEDGNTVVYSAINILHYSALFMQLLPPDVANGQTMEERKVALREIVFQGDVSFQQSVAACVGYIRKKFSHLTVTEALVEFDNRYLECKWTAAERSCLREDTGREFLKFELAKSCQPD